MSEDTKTHATPAEVASLLGWTLKQVYGAIQRGEMPTTRQIRGARIRIPLRALRMRYAEHMQSQEVSGC